MAIYIYGLYCPKSGDLRYIGKAIDLKRRLTRHLKDSGIPSYKGHWIAQLARGGLVPELRVIRTASLGQNWRDLEREEIAKAISAGCRLTNLTKGGDGIEWATPELAADWSKRRGEHSRALWVKRGDELAAKIGKSRREPAARARTAEIARSMHADPEFKERHRQATRDALQREDVKQSLSAAQLASWRLNKEARCRAVFTNQTREKMSAAAKARWSDPIKGFVARETAASPERRKQLSDSAKRRATPEYRAMMAEKTRLSWGKRRQAKG